MTNEIIFRKDCSSKNSEHYLVDDEDFKFIQRIVSLIPSRKIIQKKLKK